MVTRVHPLIVKATMPLFPYEVREKLETVITSGEYEGKTYFDLIMTGAKLEDDCQTPCDISDPVLKAPIIKQAMEGEGPYQHWLEHFWNTDLKKGEGITLTTEYICDVVADALGLNLIDSYIGDVFSTLIQPIADLISKYVNGGSNLGSFRSAPDRAEEYWNKLLEQYRAGEKEKAYINLGRVCHLMADMATPAHVHGDGHIGFNWIKKLLRLINAPKFIVDVFTDAGIDDDDYEDYTGRIVDKQPDLAGTTKDTEYHYRKNLPNRWDITSNSFAVYNPDWKLFDYFKSMASITRQYDSDDVDGTRGSHPYHWTHFHLIDPTSWDHQRDINDDLTDYACDAMACDLIPTSIMHTAGIIQYFYDQVGAEYIRNSYAETVKVHADSIDIHDDTDPFAEGEIYLTFKVNGLKFSSGRMKLNSGDSRSLRDKTMTIEYSTSPDKDIIVESDCYDNDDWWVITDHEDMGHTKQAISPDSLELDKTYQYQQRSSKKCYTIHYSITKRNKLKSTQRYLVSKVMKRVNPIKLKKLMETTYKEGKTVLQTPLYLNLETKCRHFTTQKHRPCAHWNKGIDSGYNHRFFMYEYEVLKKVPNSTEHSLKELARWSGNPEIQKIYENYKAKEHQKDETVLMRMGQLTKKDDTKLIESLASIDKNNLAKSFSMECRCGVDNIADRIVRIEQLQLKQ